MTSVNVASTYLGFRWTDKFGRRKLAIGGYAGMIIFALVTALGIAFPSGTPRLVIIMLGLDLFIASFAIGVGGVGWTLQGEVFPTAVRGQAAAFAAMVDWLANFALIEVFPVWQNAIGLGGVMVCFAGWRHWRSRSYTGSCPRPRACRSRTSSDCSTHLRKRIPVPQFAHNTGLLRRHLDREVNR